MAWEVCTVHLKLRRNLSLKLIIFFSLFQCKMFVFFVFFCFKIKFCLFNEKISQNIMQKFNSKNIFQELKKPIINETAATAIMTFILSKDYLGPSWKVCKSLALRPLFASRGLSSLILTLEVSKKLLFLDMLLSFWLDLGIFWYVFFAKSSSIISLFMKVHLKTLNSFICGMILFSTSAYEMRPQ